MSINGISRLQSYQSQARVDKEANARDQAGDALTQHAKKIDESHKLSLAEVEKSKAAREEQSVFTLIFAIVLGPLIGSAIGSAIGGAANDDTEAEARELKKQTTLTDLQTDRAFDRFQDKKGELEEARAQLRDTQKFAREVRDMGWNGQS
jgi:hypothetical protein